MLKLALTAALTTACCAAISAATGLGAAAPKVLTMKLGEIISFRSDDFHCQALTATQVACGANSLPNSVQVYFAPHQLAVVRFDKAGKKGTIKYAVKR